jgi:RibD C-terminal domain
MKQRPGKDMRVGGGATLLGSLMNHGLIDELRLVVYPIVLGGGMALLQDVMKRHAFTFPWVKPSRSGLVRLGTARNWPSRCPQIRIRRGPSASRCLAARQNGIDRGTVAGALGTDHVSPVKGH